MFTGDNVIWHRPSGALQSAATVALLRIEWSLLLNTPQQRLPMLINGPNNTQNCMFLRGISTRIYNTWFLDPHESTTSPYGISISSAVLHNTTMANTETDTQTMLRAIISVATGCISECIWRKSRTIGLSRSWAVYIQVYFVTCYLFVSSTDRGIGEIGPL